jgi:hypothetical protein
MVRTASSRPVRTEAVSSSHRAARPASTSLARRPVRLARSPREWRAGGRPAIRCPTARRRGGRVLAKACLAVPRHDRGRAGPPWLCSLPISSSTARRRQQQGLDLQEATIPGPHTLPASAGRLCCASQSGQGNSKPISRFTQINRGPPGNARSPGLTGPAPGVSCPEGQVIVAVPGTSQPVVGWVGVDPLGCSKSNPSGV